MDRPWLRWPAGKGGPVTPPSAHPPEAHSLDAAALEQRSQMQEHAAVASMVCNEMWAAWREGRFGRRVRGLGIPLTLYEDWLGEHGWSINSVDLSVYPGADPLTQRIRQAHQICRNYFFVLTADSPFYMPKRELLEQLAKWVPPTGQPVVEPVTDA